MVASSCPPTDLSKFNKYCTRTETLNEWILTVKHKKRAIRRKDKDLRVAAMLATAIRRAQTDLRQKQGERAQRWAQLRAIRFSNVPSIENEMDEQTPNNSYNFHVAAIEARKEELQRLWNSDELNGLNNLFGELNQIKTAVVR